MTDSTRSETTDSNTEDRAMMDNISFLEAKKLLRIDPLNLSEELANHPVLLQEIAEKTVGIRARRDTVKMDLELLEANISQEIRSKPEPSLKITEKSVSELTLKDERRMKKHQHYLDLSEEYDKWDTLYEAFRSRGYMLRDLASLATNVLSAPDAYVPKSYADNKAELASRRRPLTHSA